MAKVISVHSFRGGTGKSSFTANLALLLAAPNRRVAIVDTDIQSPGIHIFFGVNSKEVTYSLNDYLWGKCSIQDAAIDLTPRYGDVIKGKLFLIPSSIDAGEIVRILREGFDARTLTRGMRQIIKELNLDVLLIDTHPGLNEETMLSIAISHTLIIVLRPDQQDYAGTSVTLEVASALNVPNMMLLVNKVPPIFATHAVQEHIAASFNCRVAAVLPHAYEMMELTSSDIFALRYPDHPITHTIKHVAHMVLGE